MTPDDCTGYARAIYCAMTSRFHIRPSVLIVVVALLVLVPLLAVLQYRWIGQISEQERERMQATVQTAAFHFSRTFGEEFTTMLRIFGADPRHVKGDLSFDMAMRVQEWNHRHAIRTCSAS